MKNRDTCPLCSKPYPRHSNGRPKPCSCTISGTSDYERRMHTQMKKAFKGYSKAASHIIAMPIITTHEP